MGSTFIFRIPISEYKYSERQLAILAERERRRNIFNHHDDEDDNQTSDNDVSKYSCDDVINTQADELERLCDKVESLESNNFNDSKFRRVNYKT